MASVMLIAAALTGCVTAPEAPKEAPAPVSTAPVPVAAPVAQPAPVAPQSPAASARSPAAKPVLVAAAEVPTDFQVTAEDPAVLAAEAAAADASMTIAGLTPEQYPDVFDRIRAGFKLTDIDSRQIDQQLAWYANNPEYLERTFGRAVPYLHHIVQEIERRGMPLELALLPVVESAFEPYARSWATANGLWQFMPGTG
jgi:membrane-bound lytic murein transglycosylase D